MDLFILTTGIAEPRQESGWRASGVSFSEGWSSIDWRPSEDGSKAFPEARNSLQELCGRNVGL